MSMLIFKRFISFYFYFEYTYAMIFEEMEVKPGEQ